MLSKKALKTFPFVPVKVRHETYTYIHAEKHRLKETVLSLSLSTKFKIRYYGGEYRERAVMRRVKGQLFLCKDDYLMRLYDEDESKWSSSCLYNSEFPNKLLFETPEQEKLVLDQLRRWGVEADSAQTAVFRFQQHVMDLRRAKQHLPTINKIKADMALFGRVPAGFEKFVKDKVLYGDNFLFFDRKQKKAHCSYCEEDFDLPKTAKHNTEGKCPCCGGSFKWKSVGVGRKSMWAIRWSLVIQKNHGNLLFRYFRSDRCFWDWKKPETRTTEIYRSVITKDDWRVYEIGDYKNLGIINWRYPMKHGSYWCNNSTWYEPDSVMLYNSPASIKRMLAGSPWKNSAAELLSLKGKFVEPYAVERYLGKIYKERPYIEQLLKCGFLTLAQKEIMGYASLHNATSCKEIMGVSTETFRFLAKRAETVSQADIDVAKRFEKAFRRCPTDEEQEILSHYYPNNKWNVDYAVNTFIQLGSELGLKKLHKYLQSQSREEYAAGYGNYIRKVQVSDFSEYLGWLKKLGCYDKFYIFPKDFWQAHDLRAKEYADHQDKIKRQKEEAFNKKLKAEQKRLEKELKKGKNFRNGLRGLFLRLPESLSELDDEGKTLHHCVGSYKNKVSEGETNILFLRKIEDPDTPFYTMEVKDQKIVQVRGLKNCNPTPEVKAFVEAFGKELDKKKFSALVGCGA